MKIENQSPIKISIIGLGRLGSLLAQSLLKENFTLLGTTRKEHKFSFPVYPLSFPQIPNKEIEADIIVINIPPFKGQLEWFKKWPFPQKSWIIFVSSTSVLQKNAPTLESNASFLKNQELFFKSLNQPVTIIRSGGIIFHDSHPGLYLSGKKGVKGKNWKINLIHIDDLVSALNEIIKHRLKNKTFNIVADQHPGKKEFYTKFCQLYDRPLPEFDEDDESTREAIKLTEELKAYFTAQKNIYEIG